MCVLTADPNDDISFIANPPGKVSLKITSVSGSVTLEASSKVADSAGNAVASTVSTDGTGFSFTIAAGQTCEVSLDYYCLPPNSRGWLKENCAKGITLFAILSNTTGQTCIITA